VGITAKMGHTLCFGEGIKAYCAPTVQHRCTCDMCTKPVPWHNPTQAGRADGCDGCSVQYAVP